MKRSAIGLCTVCVAGIFLYAGIAQQREPSQVTTFKVRPPRIDFAVRKDKKVVDNLNREDFALFEEVTVTNGKKKKQEWQEREIKALFRGEDVPGRVVLVPDTSGSVFQNQAGVVKELLQSFVRTVLRKDFDAALLLPFSTSVDE